MYHNKYRLILPFVVPGLLMYGLFVLWPYTQALYVALTDWSGMTPEKDFIGLDNSARLFSDDRFSNALKHSPQLLIVRPLTSIPIALLFATLTTQKLGTVRGSGFYRFLFFAPEVLSVVVVGILWS